MLFTFPSRYWCAIGQWRVFRVGGWSPLLPTGFHVSGGTQDPARSPRGFAYGALTLSRRPSHAVPLPRGFLTPEWAVLQPRRGSRSRRFALGPRSLAATRGISVDFSSSGYLDVSVPRVASSRPMCSAAGGGVWPPPGSPIRRSAGRRASAPHRGLSQLVTSFVGFLCQGIHRVPLPSSLDGSVHTYTQAAGAAWRSDAIFLKKKISSLSHAMQLSGYGGGDPRGPDTARTGCAATGLQRALAGTAPFNKVKVVSLERLFSLERR